MEILYDNNTGIIYKVTKDSEWGDFEYFHTRIDENNKYWLLKPNGSDNVHLALDLFSLLESAENKNKCIDLLYFNKKIDDKGSHKYYIEGGKIKEKEGWEEYVDVNKIY